MTTDQEIESVRASLASAVGELGKMLKLAKSLLNAGAPEAVPAITFGYKMLELLMSATIDLAIADAFEGKSDDELWRVYDRNLKREFDIAAMRADHVDDIWYTERPQAKDFETHFVALRTAEWCAGDLGLDAVPTVRWFSESNHGDAKTFMDTPGTVGKAMEGAIWIHADHDPSRAIATCAHEAKHLSQTARGELSDHYGESEPAAYVYGKHVALRLFGKYGHGPADVWREQARQAMATHN